MKNDSQLPFWALVDQATVSATRFLIAVIVGKYGSEAELGLYAAGFGVLVTIVGLQESLITTPYTFCTTQLDKLRQLSFAGSALTFVLLYLTVVTLLLGGATAALWFFDANGDFLPIMLALALITPTSLLREFTRRWLFAHLRIRMATLLDGLFSVVTLALLLGLVWFDAVSALYALLITGLASAVIVVCAFQFRRSFNLQRRGMRGDFAKKFSFGKWSAGASLLTATMMYFAPWYLIATQGEASAGLYAACLTLVLLANPLLLGLSSILAPIAARAFSEEGKIGVRRVVSKYLLIVTVLLIGFAGILSLTGDTLLGIVFDTSYQGNQYTINVLSLAMIGIGINFNLANGLYALGHPRQDLYAAAIGLSVTIFLAWLTQPSNPAQMANCFTSGVFAMAIYRIAVFGLFVRR